MKPKIVLGGDRKLEAAVGAAVHAYSGVESAQENILQYALKIGPVPASIILHSVANSRSRNEMIQGLLRNSYDDQFKPFWAKCTDFLNKLSLYRNAIVHWHPHTNIYLSEDTEALKAASAIGNPMLGRTSRSLELGDFPPFMQDCAYIREELLSLANYLKAGAQLPSLEKFSRPAIRPNLADLLPPPTPKEPPPQRQPSQAKLTEGEWVAKLKKEGRWPPTE